MQLSQVNTVESAAWLVGQALQARERAYAPYSQYRVGAALLTADGTVVLGCNVENVSYPATICAERVALTAAIALGKREMVGIAVATRDGGSPCGICLQVMSELGPNMAVHISDERGDFHTTTVGALLPTPFASTA